MNSSSKHCPWPTDELYVAYHDEEWGVPLHDDRASARGPGHRPQPPQGCATIGNAKAYLALREERGSFDDYLWQFVGGKPIQNRRRAMKEVPARTAESDAMSRDLLRRGFKFVGSTICYAFMQAVGMVNDHLVTCERHRAVARLRSAVR